MPNQEIVPGFVVSRFDDLLRNAIQIGEVQPGEQQIDHYQTDELLGRRCRIKAGSVGATLVHKFDHIAICLVGTVVLVDQNGNRTTVSAPDVVITKAGTQRAVLAITDVDWITVHHVENLDIDKVEETLGFQTMAEYVKAIEHKVN
jgi:quercetin dioxygenase-like cupin family protein